MRPLLSALLGVLLSFFAGLSHARQPEDTDVQFIVKPKRGVSEDALVNTLTSKGAKHHGRIKKFRARTIRVPEAAAARFLADLKHHPDVEYAEPDFKAEAHLAANDPFYANGTQWHLPKIQAPQAWDVTTGSATVVIAVLDTGVNFNHPDLAGKLLTTGYDFVFNNSTPDDYNGHGTGVAGTVAPASNNATGVAGVAWANKILPIRVLDSTGSGTYSAIANGIIYAADNGARIINLSLGGTSASVTLQDAVDYAWARGCVIVASAGNNGDNIPLYPAACQHVVAVSATNSTDTRPTWSNYGSYVTVAAPGVQITSLSGTGGYKSWDGTSFSSPVTAGVVALMASVNPQLSNAQLVNLLISNSDDIGAAGRDDYYGNGRVNASRAVTAAQSATPAPADTIVPVVTISSPAPGSTVSNIVNVTISATDNVGATSVELWVGAVRIGQSAGASATFPLDSQLYADGSLTLTARAYDAAGNLGTTAIAVNVNNVGAPDTSPPLVTISSPANNSTISGTVNVNISATDNVGVASISWYVDGNFVANTAGASATFPFNTAAYSNGLHTIQAQAYDTASPYYNTGYASVSVTIQNAAPDTTPPTVSITSPSNNSTISGNRNVSISASDNVGVTKIELHVDFIGIPVAQANAASATFSLNTRGYANGSHTLIAKAYDAAGNTATKSRTVTINNSGGDTITVTPLLSAPASGTTTGSPIDVAFTLPEAALAGSVTLTFNDGTSSRVLTLANSQGSAGARSFSFSPSAPTATAAIASGPAIPDRAYSVVLSYRDLAGNAASTSTTTNVNVETVTLTPVLTAPASNSTTGALVNVAFNLPEPALPGSVTLIFNGPATYTFTLATSLETGGAHSFSFLPTAPNASAEIAHIAGDNSLQDGFYTVTLSYRDLAGHPASTATSTNVHIDSITQAPTLTTPDSGNMTGSPISVSFSLPETALPGSVTLTFDDGTTPRVLTLAASQESAGAHTLSFAPSAPTATAAIASGPAIPDGTYAVTLSYRDQNSHPAAISTNTLVLVDTTPPVGGTMTLTPSSPVNASALLGVTLSGWTDGTPLTYQVLVDGVVMNSFGTATSVNFNGPATSGIHTLKGRISDALGHVTEVTQNFTVNTPIESWRQTWFGTTASTGIAADSADPYHTGIPNLLVFAFFGPNQNPAQARMSQLPQHTLSDGNLFFSFTQPQGVSGITYGGEWSTTLLSGDWHPISDTGSGAQHIFSVPVGGNPRLFIRLKATRP